MMASVPLGGARAGLEKGSDLPSHIASERQHGTQADIGARALSRFAAWPLHVHREGNRNFITEEFT